MENSKNLTRKKIILLHGLWTGPWIMRPMGNLLLKNGYQPIYPSFSVLRSSPDALFQKIYAVLDGLLADCSEKEPILMVGHSLGGILLLHAIASYPRPFPFRLLLIASPVQGSCMARYLGSFPWLRYFFGWSRQYLCVQKNHLRFLSSHFTEVTLGRIYGLKRRKGFNFSFLGERHDGTVRSDETYDGGETKIISLALPFRHTEILLRKAVWKQTLHFLNRGFFGEDV